MSSELETYRRLQQHLDRHPVGFPSTWSGAEIRFLKRLFTPEEAEVALQLSWEPMPLAAIARLSGDRWTAGELADRLEAMFQKGSIGWKRQEGMDHWFLLPMVVGMYEAQDGAPTLDFLAAADAYMSKPAFGASLLAVRPTQMRTIPINQSIPVEHRVATYDQIGALVEDSPGPFAVLPCICRRRKLLEGEPCRKTARVETCLGMGAVAAMVLRRNHGREITRGEALDVLRRNQEDGLVFQPANVQRPDFVCSCCGCCCGMLSVHKMLPRPVDFWTSNYFAEVDAETCSHCGKCVARCQVGAVRLPRSRKAAARVNLDRCIGCGLCVTTCPSDAIHLRTKPMETVPPEDESCLLQEIAARRKGKWARRRMVGKVVLGMRQ